MNSAKKIRAVLLIRSVGVSDMTVSWRFLKDFGLNLTSLKKIATDPAMKAKRLVFAEKHWHWIPAHWRGMSCALMSPSFSNS